jgi:CRP-like cAMP-binding protein
MADVRIAALRRSPLFDRLGLRELKQVAGAMSERRFAPGTPITVEGEVGVGFFVIADGSARVDVGGEHVRTLGTGDHFGEIALIVEAPRTATVTAETELRCFAMTSWDFRRLVESQAAVTWKVLEGMTHRLLPTSGPPAAVEQAPSPRPSGRRASRTASLLSTAADEAVTSLLPGFVAGTLGASPLALGLMEGIASATDGAARLAGGALSENPRRRPLIGFLGHLGMTVLNGLVAVAGSVTQAGLLRAGASTARGLRSPQRYAAVPEQAGSGGYGRLFGLERGVHHLAAVAGPLLAFGLLAVVGVRAAMFAAIVPGVLAVAIGAWLLHRAPRAPAGAPARATVGAPRLRVRAVYRGPLGRLMTGITLFELANFAAVLLILRATKLLERQDVPFGAAAMAVLLYVLWRLSASVACFGAGRLVDRHGPAPLMRTGILALLASYAGFAFLDGTVPHLAVCFVVAGAASGAIEAAEHVGVAQAAPEELRWSAFGSLSAVRSFGRLTATVGATAVWTFLGPQYGILFAAPLMLVAVGVMSVQDDGAGPGRPALRLALQVGLALLPAVAVAVIAALSLR